MSTLKLCSNLGYKCDWQNYELFDFEEFLEVIKFLTEREPYKVNPHFRNQVYNLRNDVLKYDFIGRLENMEEVGKYLLKFGITLRKFSPHKTNAKDKLKEYLDSNTTGIIKDIFKADFEAFGY